MTIVTCIVLFYAAFNLSITAFGLNEDVTILKPNVAQVFGHKPLDCSWGVLKPETYDFIRVAGSDNTMINICVTFSICQFGNQKVFSAHFQPISVSL